MDTLPEAAEVDETVLDMSGKYEKQDSVHLDIPDNFPVVSTGKEPAEDESDDGGEDEKDGISFTVNKNQSKETDNLVDGAEEDDGYLPALPSYSETPSHLSRYTNQPIVDYREPKTLSERVKEELLEAKRWRSFSIESTGSCEPPLLDGTPSSGHDSEIEHKIQSPWADSPSSPPRSYLNEVGSGGPRISNRDGTFSVETGF